MVKQLWTRRDIENYGFKYEPDPTKCVTYKIAVGEFNANDKRMIAEKIWTKYVHSVFINTEQPFNPPTHYDHRVMVKGHGQIDVI